MPTELSAGTKNTILGIALAALLGGVGTLIGSNAEYGKHFVRIDTVLENSQLVIQQNQEILKDIQSKSGNVSPLMEAKLDEIRFRLNLHEQRINSLEKHP